MERIKEAIEQAARNREQMHADTGKLVNVALSYQESPAQESTSRESSFKPVRHNVSTGSVSTGSSLQYPIHYETTQVHPVSSDWLQQHRILNEASDPAVLQAYKLLRTQVLKKLRDNHWNSMAVLSARSGQGSTLTAINLAISIAMEFRHTAMLVDFNLRRPGIHSYFNYEPVLGVSDYILHGTDIREMLFSPGVESLVVLPGREAFDHSSERLMSPDVQQLVAEIKQRYSSRIIIFDLPPVLEADDAVAFLDQFDAGLLVVEEGKTKKPDIAAVADLIGNKPLLGTVLNNASG